MRTKLHYDALQPGWEEIYTARRIQEETQQTKLGLGQGAGMSRIGETS